MVIQIIILQLSPIITEGNEAHVHHLVIYLCSGLNDTYVGTSGVCTEAIGDEVNTCRGGTIIGAWTIGGEVSLNNYLQYTTLLDNLLPLKQSVARCL